ncbi:LCP family protein [Virgibacillus byunsanensis]|uniref:LCP family protein n=1 Tax=Virgibacillus byunsanensis TaxID=570945 RepID=A0ABW3LJF3_9BACI
MKKKKKQRHVWLLLILSFCLSMVLYSLGSNMVSTIPDAVEDNELSSIYDNVATKVKSKMDEIVPFKDREHEQEQEQQITSAADPMYILLLSEDSQSDRTETITVLEMEPEVNKVKLLDVPKQTNVYADGKRVKTFGGLDESIEAVEDSLDIDLDYYVQVKLRMLADVVDSVGGITVQNDLSLDGVQTMEYLQTKGQDPNAMTGNLQRQIEVTQALMEKVTSLENIHLAGDVLELVNNNVETNMNFEAMVDVLMTFAKTGQSLEIIPASN